MAMLLWLWQLNLIIERCRLEVPNHGANAMRSTCRDETLLSLVRVLCHVAMAEYHLTWCWPLVVTTV